MFKVFYNPETLEIKGHSDGAISMELPYVETKQNIVVFSNYEIVLVKKKPTLRVKKASFTDVEFDKIIN